MRLVGNLPYNISTPLLFHWLATPTRARHALHAAARGGRAHGGGAFDCLPTAVSRWRCRRAFACRSSSTSRRARSAHRPRWNPRSCAWSRSPSAATRGHALEDLLRGAFSSRRKQLRNACPRSRRLRRSSASIRAATRESLARRLCVRIAQTSPAWKTLILETRKRGYAWLRRNHGPPSRRRSWLRIARNERQRR